MLYRPTRAALPCLVAQLCQDQFERNVRGFGAVSGASDPAAFDLFACDAQGATVRFENRLHLSQMRMAADFKVKGHITA